MTRRYLFARLAAAGIAAAVAVTPYASYAAEAETEETAGEETEETGETEEEAGDSEKDMKKNGKDKAADKKAEDAAAASTGSTSEGPAPEEEEPYNPNSSMAEALDEQRTMVADDDIMMIRIGYRFDDGSFDEWARGTGFVVGNRYIITRQILVDLTTQNSLYMKILKERGENYDRIGINLSNEAEVQKHIACFITDMNGKNIVVHDIAVKNGLGLVVTRDVMEMPAVVFADAKKVDLGEGSIVNAKSAGDADDRCVIRTFQGQVVIKEGQTSGYAFKPEGDAGYPIGAPVYDKRGHILGMISSDGDPVTCFTIKSLETFLTTNGIQFRTIEQIEEEGSRYDEQSSDSDVENAESVVSDKTELEAAIERAQAVKESRYTAESYQAMKEALQNAIRVDENLEATQKQVDDAAASLNEKIDQLEPSGFFRMLVKKFRSMNKLPLVLIALLAAVLWFLASTGRKLRLQAQEGKGDGTRTKERPDRKKKREEEADDSDIDITNRPDRKPRRKPGDYDPGVEYAEDTEEGSGLLDDDDDGSEDTVFLKNKAYLERTENGRKIPITKNGFIIGKERKKVDYCISGNKTVSRQHCLVNVIDGKYYIEDNDSANYTTVNGNRIKPYANAHIKDGDRIMLSDVEFIFHCQN